MEKEFIPYEQALALRELSYKDIFPLGYYTDILGITFKRNYHEFPLINDSVAFTIAPTFSQAFRWFRDEYDLYFEIKKNYDGFSFLYYEGSELNKDYWINYILEMSDPEKRKQHIYKTYEEAELKCLKKLIEITKTK